MSVLLTAGTILLSNFSSYFNISLASHESLTLHTFLPLKPSFSSFSSFSSSSSSPSSLSSLTPQLCQHFEWFFVYYSLDSTPSSSSQEPIDCEKMFLSLETQPLPEILFALHQQEETLLIPKDRTVCLSSYQENTVLKVSFQNVQDEFQCSPSIQLNYPLRFDLYLLVDWFSISSLFQDNNFASNWPLICASLENVIGQDRSTTILTIISDLKVDKTSLSYWLNLCRLEDSVLRIHQRSVQSYPTSQGESFCAVDKVYGQSVDVSHLTSSLLCLEDIFDLLPSPPEAFISPIGLDSIYSSQKKGVHERHIADLNAILLANLNQERISSFVHSFRLQSILKWFVKSLLDKNFLRSLKPIHQNFGKTLQSLFESQVEKEWNETFHYFTFHLVEWFGLSNADSQLMPRAPFDIFQESFNRFQFIKYFQVIVQRYLPFGSVGKQSILDGDPLSRFLLGETLVGYANYRGGEDSSFKFLIESGIHLKDPSRTQGAFENLILETHQILSFEYSDYSVVISSTHVLVFLSPSELHSGRDLLQKWKNECQYCHLISTFVLFVIEGSDEILDIHSSVRGEYRTILLTVSDYLLHTGVESDLIVVLIGLSAMKGFVLPGTNGLIPMPVISEVSFVRLFSSLVFSARKYETTLESASISLIDLHSFVSTSQQLSEMLRFILAHSLSGYTDDMLRYVLFEYLISQRERWDIRIDLLYELFDREMISRPGISFLPNPEKMRLPEVDFTQSLERATQTLANMVDPLGVYQAVTEELLRGDYVYGAIVLYYFALYQISDISRLCLAFLHLIPRDFKFLSYLIPIQKKIQLIEYLQGFMNQLITLDSLQWFIFLLKRNLYALYWDIGDVNSAVAIYQDTIPPPPSLQDVMRQRQSWASTRIALSGMGRRKKPLYLTYADQMKSGLHNLLFSATVADINLEILGFGQQWRGFHQKFESYLSDLEKTEIVDDDIVVLMDGFDVLVFPSVAEIDVKLAKFSTPIVACAENGPHIDRPSQWFYKKGYLKSYSYNLGTKFVNSGCLIGRVQEMKALLKASLSSMMETHGDDQLAVMEYLFAHPHQVSVDVSNELFLCVYKVRDEQLAVNQKTGKLIFRNQPSDIGLLHFNSGMVTGVSNSLIIQLTSYFSNK